MISRKELENMTATVEIIANYLKKGKKDSNDTSTKQENLLAKMETEYNEIEKLKQALADKESQEQENNES